MRGERRKWERREDSEREEKIVRVWRGERQRTRVRNLKGSDARTAGGGAGREWLKRRHDPHPPAARLPGPYFD